MKEFFEKNKTFIGIIIAAFIIGGFIYLSKTNPTTTPLTENILSPLAREEENQETKEIFSTCIDFKKAGDYVGEYKCVTGKVENVYISKKGNIFFNFCQNYKTCPFFAVIFASDSYKFSDPKKYQGKLVELRGLIKTYQGRAEIILNDPLQIKIK
jgi:DNA/RNA endonuclease YhcR with UshA esterase domain